MIFSGVIEKCLAGVITAALFSSLAGCGGESSPDDAPAAKAPTSATPTADQADVDVAAVTDLVNRYWAARVEAQNSGDESAAQFADLAQGPFIETTLKSIRDANADGTTRTGRPDIAEIEVAVTGDSANIMACLNEDGWPFVKDGKDVGFEKRGTGPWGAQATRSGDFWMITDARLPPKGAKVCA